MTDFHNFSTKTQKSLQIVLQVFRKIAAKS